MTVCLDEMGPEASKNFLGPRLMYESDGQQSAEHVQQEADDGRRGKGYVFGASCPATGAAYEPNASRSAANFADFLANVDASLTPMGRRVYAIVDNLSAHRATCCCSLWPARSGSLSSSPGAPPI